MELLGQTKKRKVEGETECSLGKKKSRRSSCDVVGYPTEKHEGESDQRKKELELRKIEQQANVQKQQYGKMRLFMQQYSSCSKPKCCSLCLPKRNNLEAVVGTLPS